MIKKLIIKKLVKKWQNYLGLDKFKIYVIRENQRILNGSWVNDKRAKSWKNYIVKGDNFFSIEKGVIFIRLNKNLTKKEIEENIIHELLHVKVEQDEEWIVIELTKYLRR